MVFSSVHTPTYPTHTTSQILSFSSRDMDLITLLLKCPQAFNEVFLFLFFQQQYIHFFFFFPVTFGNLSVEKHCPSGEPCQGVRKMYISVELDHSQVLNLPFPPLKAGMSRPSSSCRSPLPPNPPNLSGCRKYLEQE